jgi:hypothetical protein
MEIIEIVYPYLRLKKKQADLALSVLRQMPGSGRTLRPDKLLSLARLVDGFSSLNYSKKRTNTSKELEIFLRNKSLIP